MAYVCNNTPGGISGRSNKTGGEEELINSILCFVGVAKLNRNMSLVTMLIFFLLTRLISLTYSLSHFYAVSSRNMILDIVLTFLYLISLTYIMQYLNFANFHSLFIEWNGSKEIIPHVLPFPFLPFKSSELELLDTTTN